jgi:hypothetical protein
MISTKKNPFTFQLVNVGSNPVLELTNATDQTFKCVEILTVFLKDKETTGPSQVHIRFEAVDNIPPKAKSIVPHTTLINRKPVDSELDQLGRLQVIAGEVSPYVLDISWQDVEGKTRFQRIPVGH